MHQPLHQSEDFFLALINKTFKIIILIVKSLMCIDACPVPAMWSFSEVVLEVKRPGFPVGGVGGGARGVECGVDRSIKAAVCILDNVLL